MLKAKKMFLVMFVFYMILFSFSSFTMLYEFVIPHGGFYVEDPTTTSTTTTTTPISQTTSGSGTLTDTITTITSTTTTTSTIVYPDQLPTVLSNGTILGTYENDEALITIYQIRASNSDVFVADVVVKDAHTILSGLAYNTFGGTNIVQTVSTMATEHDAIFAVNADYASHYDSGYVIRNGMILRNSTSYRNAIALYENGTVSSFAESSVSINDVLNDGAWQLWSFGPVIIKDGVSVASVNDGLDRDAVNNPRTAFGYVSANHFMFVCVDGRTTQSHGVDIEELSGIMMSLNCVQAYNFDGGGSSTMYFNGEIINHPSEGSERSVSDCVYIRR